MLLAHYSIGSWNGCSLKKGVRDFVLTFLALGLTGISPREFLVLYGQGANGKSTLMKVLYHMFGTVLDENKAKVGGSIFDRRHSLHSPSVRRNQGETPGRI